MESAKIKRMISIICSLIGFVFSLYGLIIGLKSADADGLDQLGVIFIMPCIVALFIITLDCLITVSKSKGGLIYSYISSFIKIGIILCLIPTTIQNYKNEMKFGTSNFKFDLFLIALLAIVTIPSILNIIRLRINKPTI